jgi:arylsulfatase A-like enzyme
VPLVIRHPQLTASARDDLLASHVDIAPTLLALCGVPPLEGMHGRDLSPLLTGTAGAPRPESVYAQGQIGKPGEWRMIVRGLDKLIVDFHNDITHLFNLGQDPSESQNLVQDRSTRLIRDELQALMRVWARQTGDRITRSGLRTRD